MQGTKELVQDFVKLSHDILADNLVGIYLHGSAAMGCFNWNKSDIDLLIVVFQAVTDKIKRQYMDMVVELNQDAPEKGIELSVVRRDVLKPFIYPTPFELHFSNVHLAWYRTAPDDYIKKMKGRDKDLAAHCTIICHRGRCLYGEEIQDVFGNVRADFYFDSILDDIEDAEKEIITNPVYMILNMCRVLAYKRNALILSKREGGSWGLSNIPEKYRKLILQALEEYSSDMSMKWDSVLLHDYAIYMKEQIKSPINSSLSTN